MIPVTFSKHLQKNDRDHEEAQRRGGVAAP
jgi:hypothetical protein